MVAYSVIVPVKVGRQEKQLFGAAGELATLAGSCLGHARARLLSGAHAALLTSLTSLWLVKGFGFAQGAL